MIHIEEVTPDNWREGLKVSKEQENFVSSDMKILARAYAYREFRSHAYIICNDDTAVGMALYYDCEEMEAYDFSQFFIDERYQGRGFGKIAAQKVLDKMKEDGKYKHVILCYIEGNVGAKHMYESLGFYETGDADEDEIVMKMDLK